MTVDRYPELAGKVALVAGTDARTVLDVVRALARNRMPVAAVAPDRVAMTTAAAEWTHGDASVIAVTGDPADPQLWHRVAPHAEQRLGPIDVLVLAGEPAMHDLVVAALLPDMAARARGVIIEVGAGAGRDLPAGVQHYLATTASEVVKLAAVGSA